MNVKLSNQCYYMAWRFVVVLVLAAAVFSVQAGGRFDKGLLWKIEPAGAAPSYLFGTMHTDDPRVVQLPALVEQAFDRASSITLWWASR